MATPTTHELPTDPKYDNYDFPTTSPYPQTGHPGHTTAEQDAQVHQLRAMLEQDGCKDRLDTLTMLRFLRARKFNVQLSKQMFLDCEKWRKEFQADKFPGGVDDLVRNFNYEEKPQVFEYYPQYYHKTDKDGRPVYIEQLGKIDLTAMYKITTGDRMLSSLVVEYEKFADPRLPACCRKTGSLHETSCTIMDLKGVGLGKASSVYGYLQQASAISQNYYPERLGKLYVINAPWGFATVFAVVKRFLDPVTVAKIHVYGGGYEADLLKQIPKENLPKVFGGSCECPGGCMFSDDGPWQDSKWARTPWWAKTESETKEADSGAIKNEPSGIKSADGTSTTDGNAEPATGEVKAPAATA